MLVKTIQHPGVEIVESEIGSYSTTIVMNNAYVMGFTDKGPLYDFSAISNESEFTKIYGTPQTEAEKYVMFAVKSILNNGGTPIIARMPYDNKQCQTYKGIAMSWDTENNTTSPIHALSSVASGIQYNKELSTIISDASLNDSIIALNNYKKGLSGSVGAEKYSDIEIISANASVDIDAELLGIPANAVYSTYKLFNTTSSTTSSYSSNEYVNFDLVKVHSFNSYLSASVNSDTFIIDFDTPSSLKDEINNIADNPETYKVASASISGILNACAITDGNSLSGYRIHNLSNFTDLETRKTYLSGISNILTTAKSPFKKYFNSTTFTFDYDELEKAARNNNIGQLLTEKLTGSFDYALSASSYEPATKPVYYKDDEGDLYRLDSVNNILSSKYELANGVIEDVSAKVIQSLSTFSNISSENLYGYDYKTVGSINIDSVTSTIFDDNATSAELYEAFGCIQALYNDPIFQNLNDENTYTNIEASLLSTTEIGFKNMLKLKSKSVEINNEQYDDLVTVNKFTSVDYSTSQYGESIEDQNFVVIDKQKSVAAGDTGNIGYFITVLDPFDGLKVQRLLVNPSPEKNVDTVTVNGVSYKLDHTSTNKSGLDYWAYESKKAWNTLYDDMIDRMDSIEYITNADGVKIGLISDSADNVTSDNVWNIPLTGTYYEESFSKNLMKNYPRFALADIDEDIVAANGAQCIIDKDYSSCIMIAVCKTAIDKTTGKLGVNIIETYFGSLFNETNPQTGRSKFIGNLINGNSDYIEFYRNNYVESADSAYAPADYQQTTVPQIFIQHSTELKTAAEMRGINEDDYLDNNGKFDEKKYNKALNALSIYPINKDECCIYNIGWNVEFTSFSKKESQKIIANTNNMYSSSDGTVANVASNFLIDMDRCIKFIKNIDDIPLAFICDAGISTIAQFCDNVTWNPKKRAITGWNSVTNKPIVETVGGWCTQPFDPDNDPDVEDRTIEDYTSCATWRKVVDKIISIAGEIRKDCFAIIDAPRQLTLDGAAPKIRRTKFTNNFDKQIGKALRFVSGLNSSYAAGYYNWLRAVDTYSGTAMWIPPSVKLIGKYCYLNAPAVNLPWLAPAGLSYGVLNDIIGISHNPDYDEEDQIYSKSWNYVKLYPTEGFVVEGQRTLLGKESVFERVNVRLLFLDLERYAYNVSKNYKYKVNNTYTREQYVATLTTKFSDYSARGGIYEYLIVCDETNNTPQTIDANELRCDLFIKPARLIEFVLLSFVGTTTGTDFSELLISNS